jgi:hypothetical protein
MCIHFKVYKYEYADKCMYLYIYHVPIIHEYLFLSVYIGSLAPLPVALGYYSIGDINSIESTRSGEIIAPIGFYSLAGVLYRCPAGYYGVSEGMSIQYCSGPCYAGTNTFVYMYFVYIHLFPIFIYTYV